MPAALSAAHAQARTFIKQARAFLLEANHQQALKALELAERVLVEEPKPLPWDHEDDLALVRLGGDGCPHCD
jgi:hypothetical protein